MVRIFYHRKDSILLSPFSAILTAHPAAFIRFSGMAYSHQVAVDAAEENYSLQTRLSALVEEEEQIQKTQEKYARLEEPLDTSALDKTKGKNYSLVAEIGNLEHELASLRTINVTELYHEYKRLDVRRGFLSNEVASLRRVLANQSKDVRRATQAVNDHHKLRKENDEHQATAKADTQMFKEKRDELTSETHMLLRKERRLEAELESLPAPGESYEAMARRLNEDNGKKDATIENLTANLVVEQQRYETAKADANNADEIRRLRDEYVRLNEILKQKREASRR